MLPDWQLFRTSPHYSAVFLMEGQAHDAEFLYVLAAAWV
jgi:hypothetical protein